MIESQMGEEAKEYLSRANKILKKKKSLPKKSDKDRKVANDSISGENVSGFVEIGKNNELSTPSSSSPQKSFGKKEGQKKMEFRKK